MQDRTANLSTVKINGKQEINTEFCLGNLR